MSSPIDIDLAEWLPYFTLVWDLFADNPIFPILAISAVAVLALGILSGASRASDQ